MTPILACGLGIASSVLTSGFGAAACGPLLVQGVIALHERFKAKHFGIPDRPVYEDALDAINGYAKSLSRLNQFEWDPHTVVASRQLACAVNVMEKARTYLLMEEATTAERRKGEELKAKALLIEMRDTVSHALHLETNRQVDLLRQQVDFLTLSLPLREYERAAASRAQKAHQAEIKGEQRFKDTCDASSGKPYSLNSRASRNPQGECGRQQEAGRAEEELTAMKAWDSEFTSVETP